MIVLNPQRLGDRGRIPRPLADRIREKVAVSEGGCWVWSGTLDGAGYGRIWTGSRVVGNRTSTLAHRASYLAFVGPIAEGMVLDHLCRNRACVNPDHLEPVTQQVNLLRGETLQAANRRKTHCPKGHAYDEANTLHYRGKRYCRACRKR